MNLGTFVLFFCLFVCFVLIFVFFFSVGRVLSVALNIPDFVLIEIGQMFFNEK